MNLADRLKEFNAGINSYKTAKNITPSPFNPEFAIADSLSLEDLEKLTQDDCFNYAYQLYQYAECMGKERAECENVLNWCETNLQSILSELLTSGIWDQYAKHEVKVATILRNDSLARMVNEWKMTAQGRLEHVKSREYNLRRKAEILIEKGKRK